MSFEQLMEHASEIKYLATKHALDNKEAEPEYARNGVDGYYGQLVEPLFKPFSQIPDPAKYQPMIDDLSSVMHDLSSGRTNEDPIDKDPYLANRRWTRCTRRATTWRTVPARLRCCSSRSSLTRSRRSRPTSSSLRRS
jgi:hypothetical protein